MARDKEAIDAREGAFRVLLRVDQEGAYANLALKQVLDTCALSREDARLATYIVYGTARCRLSLDHILSRLLTRPLDQLMPEVKVILRLSLYQLHYMDKSQPYAVTDQAVRLAKRHANPALAKVVNGVLRSYLRQDKDSLLPPRSAGEAYLEHTLSYPRWMVDYLVRELDFQRAEQFFLANNRPPGVYARVNPLREDQDQLIPDLAEEGIVAAPAGFTPHTLLLTGGAPGASACFKSGRFTIQGAAAQLPALALSPAPGSRVLDLTAAPGGKTTQLAELMGDRGDIRAFDVHPHKIGLIENALRRLGLTSVTCQAANAAQLPPAFRRWADYVLLDVPCSGLGVLNSRPDSRYHQQRENISILAEQGLNLLHAAADYLRPGGLLCYSTCTVTREENGDNIARFLSQRPDLRLEPIRGLAGLPPGLRPETGQVQLWPQTHNCEGFYFALLRKVDQHE